MGLTLTKTLNTFALSLPSLIRMLPRLGLLRCFPASPSSSPQPCTFIRLPSTISDAFRFKGKKASEPRGQFLLTADAQVKRGCPPPPSKTLPKSRMTLETAMPALMTGGSADNCFTLFCPHQMAPRRPLVLRCKDSFEASMWIRAVRRAIHSAAGSARRKEGAEPEKESVAGH